MEPQRGLNGVSEGPQWSRRARSLTEGSEWLQWSLNGGPEEEELQRFHRLEFSW